MSYVKTINEDGVVSDIMAKALDPTLDATILKNSNLVNGFTQTTAGVNALDAAAGKTLNDSLANLSTDVSTNYATKTDLSNSIKSVKYIIRKTTASTSIGAGFTAQYWNLTSVSGYTPVAILEYDFSSSGAPAVTVVGYTIVNGQAQFRINNSRSETITPAVALTVLYKQNE